MILHFVTDEKFTDYAIQHFSCSEMESEFILIPSNFSGIDCSVRQIDKCRIIHYQSQEFEQLLCELGKYKAIVLYGLFWKWTEDVLKSVPENTKVAWMFWGGEIYGRPDLTNQFFMPITKTVTFLHDFQKNNNKVKPSWFLPSEHFRKIDYCLTDMSEECDFAQKYLKHNMKMLWYNYYSIDETVGASLINQSCSGNDIFVGNSADSNNNHIELFLKLRRLSIGDGKIIAPLSYGSSWYRNIIIKLGNFCFGKKFSPLVKFIKRSEYNRIMLSCNTMIQPHYRAQAQGNIITGLWLGMRVYLSERNFAYQYFKRLGIIIYSIERDLNSNNKNIFSRMSEEDIHKNREILNQTYGLEAMIKSAKLIVEELNS